MKGVSKYLVLVMSAVILFSFTSAMRLELTADYNNTTSKMVISAEDRQGIPFIAPPNNYSALYSNSSNNSKYLLDIWNGVDEETFNIVYVFNYTDGNPEGDLVLSWDNSEVDEIFNLELSVFDKNNGEMDNSPIDMAAKNNITITKFDGHTFQITASVIEEEKSGGGSSGGSIPLNRNLTDSNLNSGYEGYLRVNGTLFFMTNNDNHSLKLLEVLNNSIRILVQSEPKEYELEVNKLKKIDLEDDGFYDIEVNYTKKVSNILAGVFIKKINEQYRFDSEEKDDKIIGEGGDSEVEEGISTGILIIIIALIIIILVIISLFFMKGKKEDNSIKEKRYEIENLIRQSEEELNTDKRGAKEIYSQAREKYYEYKINKIDEDKEIYKKLLALSKKLN